jgi:hypothetical protein
MITQPATAEDFARWTKQAERFGDNELIFSIDDCLTAAEAMATHPKPNREGYYRDQALTFKAELTKRQKKAAVKVKRVYLAMVPHFNDFTEKNAVKASFSREKIVQFIAELPLDFQQESYITSLDLV